MNWPLEGVRVLDLTQNVAGPYAGTILAELGADVLKVEPPQGDPTRRWGPPFWGGYSPTYLALNRNKVGIRCDLKSEEGMAEIRRRMKTADVVLVSARPGAMQRLGLDYETLHVEYPQLIYAEVTPYGNAGPMKSEPGYDPLMQAFTGMMSVNGHSGAEPSRLGVSVIDMGCAQWVAIGVLGALRMRDATGSGHKVTGSLFETAIAWMTYHFTSYWASGESPRSWGSGTAFVVPYQAYPTADGWVVIGAGNDRLFRMLASCLGHEEWAEDPRFSSNAARIQHRNELNQEMAFVTREKATVEWETAFQAAGVPAARIQSVEESARSAQLEESGVVQTLDHPSIPAFKSVGLPLLIDGKRPDLRKIPPV